MTILHQILPSLAMPGGGTLSVYVCIKKIGVEIVKVGFRCKLPLF